MTQTPRLETLIEGTVISELGKFWTALPGRVEAFDQYTCQADVQPMVKRIYFSETGEWEEERLPQVRGCPVPATGGAAGQLTFPVRRGDLGILIFTSASIDTYMATGAELRPFDRRKNTLSDAIFLHGMHSMISSPSDYTNDAVVLRADQLRLGGVGANQALVLGDDFIDYLKNFMIALKAYIITVTPLPGTGGPGLTAFQTAITAFELALDASLSSKVFVEE